MVSAVGLSLSMVGATGAQPAAAAAQSSRVEAFEDAVAARIAAADGGAAPADAAARAREGLGLEGVQPEAAVQPTGGDMILQGLDKLRGMFDAGESRIGSIVDRGTLDAHAMVEMQMELVNFTMLVDLGSKLTGKSTQVFDTLMKGQ